MADRSIIPRDIEGFNSYIIRTNNYLILGSPTNAVRFGWTSQNLSDWQDMGTDWEPLYFKYSDKKANYTTAIKNSLEAIIARAIAYDRDNKLILKIKATVGLTPDDCATFNVPVSYAMPLMSKPFDAKSEDTHKTSMTTEAVFPRLIPVGGGFVRIACLLFAEGSGRAHKPKGYDLLEYKVAVFYHGTANLPTHHSDKRLDKEYSSKASFMLDTTNMITNLPALAEGDIEPTKMAVFFFRWAKSKHPNLDGPWSGPFNTALL